MYKSFEQFKSAALNEAYKRRGSSVCTDKLTIREFPNFNDDGMLEKAIDTILFDTDYWEGTGVFAGIT